MAATLPFPPFGPFQGRLMARRGLKEQCSQRCAEILIPRAKPTTQLTNEGAQFASRGNTASGR